MTELDRYLDRATRGLFGARRRAVREELRGNLIQQALDFQVSGLAPELALREALRVFGPPEPVSQGLRRVHTLPLAGLLIASSLGTVALGVAVREGPARQIQAPASSCAAEPASDGRPPHARCPVTSSAGEAQ